MKFKMYIGETCRTKIVDLMTISTRDHVIITTKTEEIIVRNPDIIFSNTDNMSISGFVQNAEGGTFKIKSFFLISK